jgi:hypothetical protein
MLTEHQEQKNFVKWFELQYPKIKLFAIPNGGNRNVVTATMLKAEGVRKGVPDIFIPEWRLWLEFKRVKGGKVSLEQQDWIDYLNGCGYTAVVVNGFDVAKDYVLKNCALYNIK